MILTFLAIVFIMVGLMRVIAGYYYNPYVTAIISLIGMILLTLDLILGELKEKS